MLDVGSDTWLARRAAGAQAEKLSIEGHVNVLEQALVEAVYLQTCAPPATPSPGRLARPHSSPAAPRARVRVPRLPNPTPSPTM